MQTVYRLVKQNLEDRQKKLFAEADSLPNYFDIGQSVFFYNPIVPEGQHPKFHQYWQGPYTIIQKISPVVYKIQRDDNLAEIRRAHVAPTQKKIHQKREDRVGHRAVDSSLRYTSKANWFLTCGRSQFTRFGGWHFHYVPKSLIDCVW